MDDCETCGRPGEDHSFKELLVCLYGDQGMTPEKAQTVIDRTSARLEHILGIDN